MNEAGGARRVPWNATDYAKHRMADDERYRTFIAPCGIIHTMVDVVRVDNGSSELMPMRWGLYRPHQKRQQPKRASFSMHVPKHLATTKSFRGPSNGRAASFLRLRMEDRQWGEAAVLFQCRKRRCAIDRRAVGWMWGSVRQSQPGSAMHTDRHVSKWLYRAHPPTDACVPSARPFRIVAWRFGRNRASDACSEWCAASLAGVTTRQFPGQWRGHELDWAHHIIPDFAWLTFFCTAIVLSGSRCFRSA